MSLLYDPAFVVMVVINLSVYSLNSTDTSMSDIPVVF